MTWIGLILSCKKKNLLETPKKNLTKVHKSKKALKHRTVGSANVPVCAFIYIIHIHRIISHLLPYHTMQLRFLHLHRHFLGFPSAAAPSPGTQEGLRATSVVTSLTIGFPPIWALFCWYSCVNYWLNPQIWVWGYDSLRPNFYGKTVCTCQKRRLLKGNHPRPTIHFQFFNFSYFQAG